MIRYMSCVIPYFRIFHAFKQFRYLRSDIGCHHYACKGGLNVGDNEVDVNMDGGGDGDKADGAKRGWPAS